MTTVIECDVEVSGWGIVAVIVVAQLPGALEIFLFAISFEPPEADSPIRGPSR